MPRRPDPLDEHIGSRLRLRRTLLGFSQERLGKLLDLTFQQIQKYERGANRVGSGRLFRLAQILEVEVTYFYEDMPDHLRVDAGAAPLSAFSDQGQEQYDDSALAKRETLELVRAYYKIPNRDLRLRVFDLVKAVAGESSLGVDLGAVMRGED